MHSSKRNQTTLTTGIVIVLALLMTVGPISTDLYLPAFPEMLADLQTSPSAVQLSLTAFFFGAATGQLFFGYLSDRFGRKTPLLIGLTVYLVASVLAAVAPNITLVILFRLIQGFTGAASMVITRVIAADLAKGADLARVLSVMMIIGGIAPVAAPVVGSMLAPSIGWRGLIAVMGLLSVLMIPLVVGLIPETGIRRSVARRDSQGSVHAAKLHPVFWGYVSSFVLAFAGLMAYISASPFVFQNLIGMSEYMYGVIIGVNAIGMSLAGAFSVARVRRFGAVKLASVGFGMNFVAVIVLVALVLADAEPWIFLIPLFFVASSVGLIFGNVTAKTLESLPGRSGTASAVQGFFQFMVGGLVAPIVGLAGEYSATPMAGTLAVTATGALITFFLTQRRDSSAHAPASP